MLRVDADDARLQLTHNLNGGASLNMPLLGLTVSVKDLFDVAGQVTHAGAVCLDKASPATTDAPALARLKQAGAVSIGRTNMTEFAFSGIGINHHYGTPANPADATTPASLAARPAALQSVLVSVWLISVWEVTPGVRCEFQRRCVDLLGLNLRRAWSL